jgi:hypothetical protein
LLKVTRIGWPTPTVDPRGGTTESTPNVADGLSVWKEIAVLVVLPAEFFAETVS